MGKKAMGQRACVWLERSLDPLCTQQQHLALPRAHQAPHDHAMQSQGTAWSSLPNLDQPIGKSHTATNPSRQHLCHAEDAAGESHARR